MTSRLSASTPSACHRRGYGCIGVSFRGMGGSRDDDLGDPSGGRALRDEERKLSQRVLLAVGLDRPPDRVATDRAGGQRRAMAEGTLVALEGGECDAALVRLVAVLDDEAGHAARLTPRPRPYIGRPPGYLTLSSRAGLCSRGVVEMTLVSEHLVGRAAQLGALDGAVEALKREGPAAALLVGEPGIGKTRLLAELAGQADARGHIVLTGSASELEADLPFWVFVDALDEFVAGLEPRRLSSLDGQVRAELELVLPSMPRQEAPAGPALQDERYRTHRAVRALLECIAAKAPLVLVLDDVHWADPASIDLLAALLRTPPSAAVLLALAARPRQLPERLAGALERARRAGRLTRVELGALGREEAGELLGDAVKGSLADTLYGLSGGNPFYLEQLARSAGRTGESATVPGSGTMGGVEVPPAVAASVTGELALLSPGSRRLLDGAAVAGDPFEPDLAAVAAALRQTVAAEGLDDLLALGLIRSTEVPRRFRFRHPLIRRAVYEAAPGGWLLGAHERCAQELTRRGAAPAVRAHHVEHAARDGDAAAASLLHDAGAAAASRAPESAARWFGSALRLLPDSAPAEQRLALLTARAGALVAIGQLAAARRDLLEGMDLLPADAVAPRTGLTAACAGIEHLLGDHEQAHERLAGALTRLPDPASRDAVALRLELAIGSLFDADYGAMRDS